MYSVLTITGGVIGLIVTGAAVFVAWSGIEAARRDKLENKQADGGESSRMESLRRWTVMDYAALTLFVLGSLLLFADLIAVSRDRESYPYYHYGYLFSAFIFMIVGMLFTTVRLGVLLHRPKNLNHVSDGLPPLHHEHGEPYKAD